MNWRAEAIEKLQGYEAHCQALEYIPQELSRLGVCATGIRAAQLDGMPRAGSCSSSRENYMLDNITCRDDLQRKLKEAKLWVDIVNRGLSILDDEERLALELCFIHRAKGAIMELCERLNVEKSTAYHRRDDALRRFTMALYGALETL